LPVVISSSVTFVVGSPSAVLKLDLEVDAVGESPEESIGGTQGR
jgi:hypothetical protein